MKRSEQINEISTAVSKLQAEVKGAEKGAENPFFKNKYSTLEDIWNSVRDPLGKNGLSIFQELLTEENSVSVVTFISHSSGQWLEFGPFQVPFGKKDAQSIGSASSYAKRYALCAAIGIVSASEDDDGNQATKEEKRRISQEQVDQLLSLIDDDAALIKRICAGYQVTDLRDVPLSEFPKIMRNLQLRKQ